MYGKKGSQIDIADLDFSKAFDTVPHDGKKKNVVIIMMAYSVNSSTTA